jgi:hypothetical protein
VRNGPRGASSAAEGLPRRIAWLALASASAVLGLMVIAGRAELSGLARLFLEVLVYSVAITVLSVAVLRRVAPRVMPRRPRAGIAIAVPILFATTAAGALLGNLLLLASGVLQPAVF